MSLAMQAAQQAIVARLSGDAVLMDRIAQIYDVVPQQSPLPYAVIEQIEQETLAVMGQPLWRVGVIIEVWTEAQGRKTALMALERMHALLHHGALSMAAFTLREMRVESAGCVLAEQASRVVGSMELSLVVAAN
jgi:hypothetical protein